MAHQLLPLSALERIGLYTALIDAFPDGHPLKRYRGDVYHEIINFYRLFALMAQEGWTSSLVNQAIDTHIGAQAPEALPGVTEWAEKLRAAVHEFDNFQALLAQMNRFDTSHIAPGPGLSGREDGQQTVPGSPLPGDAAYATVEVLYSPAALLAHPLIEKIVVLLNYLAAEKEIPSAGEAMLFELLHGPWFQIPPAAITSLARDVADRQYTEYITTLRRLLYERAHLAPANLFAAGPPPGIKKASAAIERLIAMTDQASLPALYDALLQETGIADYIKNSPDQATLEPPVQEFAQLIAAEAARNPTMTLPQLVKLLSLVPYTSWAVSLPPADPDSTPLGRLAAIYRPSTVQQESTVDTEAEIIPLHKGPTIHRLELYVENQLVQRFVMHATALNSYLRCPLEFYYHILIRTPFPRNEATEFGSAVHHALELLFRKMQSNHETFPPRATFIKDFEDYLHRRRASFTTEQFNRRLAYGQRVLGNYYDEYLHRWNTIVSVERNFRNVVVQGVPLKGKVDKLEFDGHSVNLVDYKTGDPDKSAGRLSPPAPSIPYGGDYWRQAVFYKILVDNYQQKTWQVTSAEFDFIEPDQRGIYHKEKLFIGAGDVETVTQQFRAVWQRIIDRDFYTGCGKPYCHWCHFVKSYGLARTPDE